MTSIASGVDYKSAPSDYAALFTIYYRYIVNLVAKNGIDDNNKEEVACDIIMHLIDIDIIGQFDPDLVFEYQGSMRPARFKSFLSRRVFTYCKHYRDKQKRLAARELQLCDQHLTSQRAGSSKEVSPDTWVDIHGTPHPDHADTVIELVGEQQDATWLRTWLASRPRRSTHDRCDLVELFDAVRQQVLTTGEYNIADLRAQFQLSTTTMHVWLWWLKANVAEAYGRPTPPKRSRQPKTEPEP